MGARIVGGDGKHVDVGARARQRSGDHAPIRLVDLTGLELLARVSELVTGGEDRDPWPSRTSDRCDAGGGKSADLHRAKHRAGLDDDGAGTHVAAARTDVLTGDGGLRDEQMLAAILDHLDRDDCIRSRRDGPAGRDARSRTFRQWTGRCRTGGDAKRDRQLCGCFRGADGKAVHRGARKRWQVDGGASRFAKHSAKSHVE